MSANVNFQIFDLIAKSDAITTTIYLILLSFSLCSWAIIFDKIYKFRLLKMKTEKFNKLFFSGKMLEDIYKQVKTNQTYPSAFIFSAGMQEWESNNVLDIVQANDAGKKNSLKERIMNVMDVAIVKSTTKIKYGMTFLLIVSTTSTFFGLFGTVWGLMTSFLSIASLQDTSLIVIAPGITSALVTTIFGLISAIPATIFYNYYNVKINEFEDQMANFSLDVITILSRELDQ